jgi:hypothetical protein
MHGNKGQSYDLDFENGTFTHKQDIDLTTEDPTANLRIETNQFGHLIITGKILRKSSLFSFDAPNTETSFSTDITGGEFGEIVTNRNSPFYFTALTNPDDGVTLNTDKILKFNHIFESRTPVVYTSGYSIKAMHWKHNSNYLLVISSARTDIRQVYDTTLDSDNSTPISVHTKVGTDLQTIDFDVTGPENDDDVYIVIQEDLMIKAIDFITTPTGFANVLREERLTILENETPYSEVFRVKALGRSKYVLALTNWHYLGIWNYEDNTSVARLIDVKINRLSDVVIFEK